MPFDQPSIRAVFAQIDQGFCVAEIVTNDAGDGVDYRFLEVNGEFEAMTGLTDPVGKTAMELVPGLESRWVEMYSRVGLGRETLRFSEGSDVMGRWFDVIAVPVEPVGRFAVVFNDVTQRHIHETAALEAARFTGRVLNQLSAFVAVLSPDGFVLEINRVALDSGSPGGNVAGRRFWECDWWNHSPATAAAIQTSVEQAALGQETQFDVQIQVASGQLRWVDYQITALQDPDGSVTHLVPVAHDISERIDAEQATQAALDAERRARRRVEVLQTAASGFAAVQTRAALADEMLDRLRESMSIELAAVNFVVDDRVDIVANGVTDDGVIQRYEGLTLEADLPGTVAIRENRVLVLSGRDAVSARFPHLDLSKYAIETIVAVPLNDSHGTPIGAVVLGSPQADWADGPDADLLLTLARQAGLVVERVLLHEQLVESVQREHEIALSLQKSLLPRSLVANRSLTMSAHYSAAADLMAVGGDWYDTFQWNDRHVALVVGDVAGHDVEATTKMGRLCSGVTALAPMLDPRPDALLDAYHHCARINSIDFATAACAVIDTQTACLEYSLAGHPPPLLLLPDGSTEWLDDPVAPPLGAGERRHLSSSRPLPIGSTILLYSDGLVERREEPIDVGMERLAASLRRHRDAPSHQLARLILDDVLDVGGATDDVILLFATFSGE